MKLLKRSLVLLGCALATAAAFTACELELGNNDDRLETNQDAVSKIEVTGQTTTFTKGADFSLGAGVVTATYVNGTTAPVTDKVKQSGFSSSEVSDDVTVTLSYTEDGRTVSTSYNVSIILPVKNIEVTKQPAKTTYNLYIQNVPMLDLTGLEVTATYEDDSEAIVPVDQLQVSAPTKQGENDLTITYAEKTAKLTVTVTEFISVEKCGYTGSYTADDWWIECSPNNVEVAVGKAVQTVFVNNSYGTSNWGGPVYKLATADDSSEHAVLRNDNYGWGVDYAEESEPQKLFDDIVVESNWDFDQDGGIAKDISGSKEYVTVVNNGTSIDLYLHFVKNDKVIRYQYYKGIHNDSTAVQFRIMGDAGADITYCE